MSVRTPERRPALVLGLSPTGLIAIRSLGRRGIPVYGADFSPWGIGRFSRYCRYRSDLTRVSQTGDGRRLVEGLAGFANDLGVKPVLYATNDSYIELLSPHFAELSRHLIPTTDLGRHGTDFLDKRHFYQLCRNQGVELPGTYFPSSASEAMSIAREILYPAIIKPARIHRFYRILKGKKVVLVEGSEELSREYERLAAVDPDLIIQEVVPGADAQIHVAACYLDAESRPRAVFVGRKLRQYPPRFGSASLAEARWESEVAELSLELLRAVGFVGICGTEYKRDLRDGRLKMMEINPRLTLWMGLTRAAGLDMPYVAYRDVTGDPLPRVNQVDGARWMYMIRDLQSAAYYMAQGELSARSWWRSVRGCVVDAILATDDLRVGLYIPSYAVGRLLRRIR